MSAGVGTVAVAGWLCFQPNRKIDEFRTRRRNRGPSTAAPRRARAELKEKLKKGGTNLKQVLTDAETDEVLGKMKVSALLEALPKVGKVKAQEIMTELEIAPTRRLRGLGDRQRKALLERFDFS
ncbi:MIHF [Mycobacteroides abscessus subsp. massiliense]|nr:MIHF [Mycobacteroides abscessus subsp. massiliense]